LVVTLVPVTANTELRAPAAKAVKLSVLLGGNAASVFMGIKIVNGFNKSVKTDNKTK